VNNPQMPARKITRRSTLFMVMGSALLALLLLATLSLASGQAHDNAVVTHTLQVQNRIALVQSLVQDAETGQRGFIITGRPDFREPYDRAVARLSTELDALEHATADNAIQQASMDRLRPLVDQRLARLRVGLGLREAGDLAGAMDAVTQGRGKVLMDAIRGELAAMRAEESRLLAMRRAQAEATAGRLRLALILGFAVLVALTAYAVMALQRQIRALIQTNAELETEAANREQAEAQVRQMQKMEAIGQLTGGIAHDFNNMLSIIIGSLDLAKRRLTSDPERATRSIDNAIDGAERAAALTSRLLAFSRQQPLAPVASDPNRLVQGMSELLRRTIGEQVKLETVLSGGIWRVNADVSQLENGILNLCVNGRDAMPDGGRLTIETANAYLDEEYAKEHQEVTPGQYVMFSVTDTGVGMPPEVIARAFDPFYTTKGVGRGTGLGLSQVFGFVKQSGGHVKIYSEIGQGTSVKIYLPRWMGELTAQAATQSVADLPEGRPGEIILVVEDDERVRKVSVESLRELGYTVIHASSGAEALQILEQEPRIDLLFTDIVMPGMTGRVLADTASERLVGLKVLYTTGYTRNAVVHNGVLDAGVAFLPKPFTIQQLAAKVRQALDGQGANRPS